MTDSGMPPKSSVWSIRTVAAIGAVVVVVLGIGAYAWTTRAGRGPTVTPSPSSAVSPSAAPTASASASASPSDPDAAVKAAILTSYRAYWAAVVKAYATNDVNSQQLRQVTSNGQLTHLIEDMIKSKSAGEVTKGQVKLAPTIQNLAVNGRSATVRDCPDGRAWLTYDAETGAPKYPGRVPKNYVTISTLELRQGTWKVTKSRIEGEC